MSRTTRTDETRTRATRAMLALLLVGLVGLQGCQAMSTASFTDASARTTLVAGSDERSLTSTSERRRARGEDALMPVCNMGPGFDISPGWMVAIMGLLVVASPFLLIYAVVTLGG